MTEFLKASIFWRAVTQLPAREQGSGREAGARTAERQGGDRSSWPVFHPPGTIRVLTPAEERADRSGRRA